MTPLILAPLVTALIAGCWAWLIAIVTREDVVPLVCMTALAAFFYALSGVVLYAEVL